MKDKVIARSIASVLLAVFLYIGVPTIDDLVAIPAIAYFLKLPIPIVILAYYGIAWTMILLIEMLIEALK